MRRTSLVLLTLLAPPALASPVLPDFGAATFVDGAPIDNTWFPIVPGLRLIYEGAGEDDGEPFTQRSIQRPAGRGPTLLGVQTSAVLDREMVNGVTIEETLDYYAQDTTGNVWYLGEKVKNYRYDDDGNFLGTDSASAWLSGVNGALPGVIMPASPFVGYNYYQEYAPADDALDQATIWALGGDVDGYSNVLVTFETTELDPDAREFKYYAPGLGLFRVDEDLDEEFADPELIVRLTSVAPVPLPAALPLLAAALAGLVAAARRRRIVGAAA